MALDSANRPKRSLGQNFLIDIEVIDRIVQATGIREGETVVEVGPGRGALTSALRERASRLICVEKDDYYAARMAEHFEGDPGAVVVHGDALELLPAGLPFPGPYRVVGNLPYNVAARIAMHLLETWGDQLTAATLMFQREVAQRLAAQPGNRSFGALSVLSQSFAETWLLFGVPPGAFRPVPKVESAIVRISPRAEPLWAGLEYEHFRTVVRGAFAFRRKTVVNALIRAPGLPSDGEVLRAVLREAGIDPSSRAEAIGVDTYVTLARLFSELATEAV